MMNKDLLAHMAMCGLRRVINFGARALAMGQATIIGACDGSEPSHDLACSNAGLRKK